MDGYNLVLQIVNYKLFYISWQWEFEIVVDCISNAEARFFVFFFEALQINIQLIEVRGREREKNATTKFTPFCSQKRFPLHKEKKKLPQGLPAAASYRWPSACVRLPHSTIAETGQAHEIPVTKRKGRRSHKQIISFHSIGADEASCRTYYHRARSDALAISGALDRLRCTDSSSPAPATGQPNCFRCPRATKHS